MSCQVSSAAQLRLKSDLKIQPAQQREDNLQFIIYNKTSTVFNIVLSVLRDTHIMDII